MKKRIIVAEATLIVVASVGLEPTRDLRPVGLAKILVMIQSKFVIILATIC